MKNGLKPNRMFLIYGLLMGVFSVYSLFITTPADASTGVNQTINFQGRLLNSQGATVADGYYNIQFKIYQDGDGQTVGNTTGSPASTLKWTENHLNANTQGVRVVNGYLSVQLGSVNAFGSSIDWNQSTLWLSMNIGGTNASCTPFSSCTPDGEMVPMQPLTSAPFALNSGQLGGIASSGFVQLAQGLQTDASNVTSIYLNKTGSGNIMDLQSSSSSVFTVGNAGATTIRGNSASLQVQNTSGTNFLNVDVSSSVVRIGVTGITGADSTVHIADSSNNIQTVSIGSASSSSTTTIRAGSGGIALTGNTTVSGSSTFSTGTGNVSLNGDTTVASGKNFTQSGAGTFSTGTGTNTLNGDTTVAGTKTLTVTGGNTSLGAKLDVTGSAAYKGIALASSGTFNNLSLASDTSLVRLTGSSTQIITGIANGRDGYILTFINAGSFAATFADNDSGSSAANRITTGNSSDFSLPVGALLTLVYDSGALLWRATSNTDLQASYNNSGSPQITLSSANGGLVVQDASSPIGASLFAVQSNGGATKYLNITSSTVAISDDLTVTGTYNTNTFTSTALQFGGASGTVSSSAGNLTIQAASTNSLILDSAGAGTVSIGNSGATTINVGANNVAHAIHVGDGGSSATQTIAIGSTGNAASAVTISAGSSGGITLAGNTTVTGANSFATGSGLVSLNGDVQIASGKTFSQSGAGTLSTGTGAVSLNGDTTVASGKNFTQSGAGTFSTGSGTNSLNGDTTVASGKNFTQSGAGTFSTGSGTNSLNGDTTVASGKIFTANGDALFQNGSPSSTAFQVQGSGGTNFLAVDTTSNIINIGITGAVNANSTIHVGDSSAGVQTVVIGSTNSTSATTIQAGSGGVTINGNTTVSGSNTFSTGTGNVALNGDTTVGLNKNFTQSGAGTFSTGSGTNSLNGDTTVASGKNFTQSGAGTFSTGTGNNNLNGNTTVASGKTFTAGGDALFQYTSTSATAFRVQNAGGNNFIALDTTSGVLNLGVTGAVNVNSTIHVGDSSAGIQTITLGSTNSSSATTIQAGSGGVTINGNTTVSGSNTFSTGTGNVALNGDTTVGLNKNFTQSGAGTFSTGTGTNSLNGNTAVASGRSFTANGSALFKINSDTTTAFQVQNSSSRGLLTVDTSGNIVTVGNSTDGAQITLGATGNVNSVLRKTMVVNGTIAANDLVEIDTSNAGQVKQSAASSAKLFGIASSAVGSGSSQDIVISGVYQVNANTSGGTVAVGDLLVSSSTVGQATKAGTTTGVGTVIGQALSAISGGKVWVYINFGIGGSDNLQTVYDKSTGSTTPEVKVDSTRGAFDVQDANSTIGGSIFTVRGSNGGGLGTALFDVQSTGAISLGSASQTTTITVGQSTASNTIAIGTAAGSGATQTINIGTSATGSSTTSISIGSSVAGTVTLNSNTTVASGKTLTANGTALFKNNSNSTTAFQVQSSGSATPILNVDTSNSRVGVNTASPGASLTVNSGVANTSGLQFQQLTNTSPVSSTFSQLLGLDASGNVGLSSAGISLTSPALAYWDGQNNPTTGSQSYPVAALTGNAIYDGANGVRLTPATATQSGSINWNFSQVSFEEIQFNFRAGGGTGADGTWFYSFANATPTSEFGTGMTSGYVIYFSEYHHCVGIAYGGYTDGNQCGSGGGANPLTSALLYNIGDNASHSVDIQIRYNIITVYWDGVAVLSYTDVYTRDLSALNFGFGARTGGSTNNHWIKGLLVTKLGTNTSQYNVNNISPLAKNLHYNNTDERLGVGTAAPTATLDVAGTSSFKSTTYSTGTVYQGTGSSLPACTNNGPTNYTANTTVTGVGTTFPTDIVGDTIILPGGVADTVTARASGTSITVSGSRVLCPGTYKIVREVFSTPSGGSQVNIGNTTTDARAVLLTLDGYNQSTDPTGTNGAMYYSSAMSSFRCYQNGAWLSCLGGLRESSTAPSTAITAAADTNFSGGTANTYTIPANDCVVGRVYRVTAYGTFSTGASVRTVVLRMKFGSAVLAATGAMTTTVVSQTNRGWTLEGLITCITTGASGTVEAQGRATISSATTGLGGLTADMPNSATVASINTTTTQTLQLGAQWDATTNTPTITMRQFVVEALGP